MTLCYATKKFMLHHHHKQKQKRKKLEPLDFLLYFFVFTTPLFEIPQALEIYSNHSADNVSWITWVYFLLANLVWLAYGIRKKIRPIIASYTCYMVVEGIIVIGIIRYS